MVMYIITGIVFLLIVVNYFLGHALYKEPSNDAYFSNVNHYNVINKKDIMASPSYVATLSILLGIFLGVYICLGNLFGMDSLIKWITVIVLLVLYLVEITRKITISDEELILERLFFPTLKIPLRSIDGMYIYSYNKKFLNKRAFTTKLVVSTSKAKYKFTLSSIDIKPIVNMMKENFGITENKMYVAKK